MAQICRSLKRKNDITRCFTTCYVVISCGGRIGHLSILSRNDLIIK
nr:MAG TPA: hypothetical protein [Caudoviricetes sp.]